MSMTQKHNDYKDARAGLVNVDFIKSQKYKDQQYRAIKLGCHPDLIEFNNAFIQKCKKMGIPVFSHCLLRTHDEQTKVYTLGHSNAKAGESPHNYGMATDIIHGLKAWNISNEAWLLMGHVGLEIAKNKGIPMKWGGDWDGDGIPVYNDKNERLWDPAHWELKHWRMFTHDYPDWNEHYRISGNWR